MSSERRIPIEAASLAGTQLRIDWTTIDREQVRRGIEVELDFGVNDPATHAIRNDLLWTGMLAWTHLKENRDYCARLDRLRSEAED